MKRVLMWLTLSLCSASALADARELEVERVQKAVERDLARGDGKAAELRLTRAIARLPAPPLLLLQYAELALPLQGAFAAAELPALRQRAERLLAAAAKEQADTHSVSLDAEQGRRILLHAAWAAALLDRSDESLAHVQAGGRLQDRTTVDCLRQIAALEVSREQLAVAERALSMARQYLPQDMVLAGELGQLLLARGAVDSAVRVLAERFAVDPRALAARRDFAYALASAGRAREGHALLADAREACLAEAGCALEAARIALEAGLFAEAARYAEEQLNRASSDLDALYLAAEAQTRAGQLPRARSLYLRVLALRPESVRAKQALEQLPEAP